MPSSPELGHFQLLEEIGHGGMGTVFKAFDPTLNRYVAIKLLTDARARDSQFVEDFLREARHAAAISHPHIVQVYFVGEAAGQYYVVMELLTGRTLDNIIEKDDPLTEEAALQIAIDVADALRAAYQNNQMVHGDIKPANIFVTAEHGAKVLDFGLAKLADVEKAEAEEIWGSPYYISPERVAGQTENFRSDIYSLGATLFHALAGRPPFDADTREALALKRLTEPPPGLRDLKPELAIPTEQLVAKMLSKSPLTRYRDYNHLLEQLRDAKSAATARRLGIEVFTEPAAPILQQPAVPAVEARPAKRFPWLGRLLVAGGVLIVAAVGVLVWSRRPLPKSGPSQAAHRPRPQPTPAPVPTATPTPPATVTALPTPAAPAPASPATPQLTAEQRRQQEQAQLETLRLQQEQVAAETMRLQATDSELMTLWQNYDFLGLIARYQTLAGQFKTPDARKLVTQRLNTAKQLAEFKTQLIADIAFAPYASGDLLTRVNAPLPGKLMKATDAEMTFATQYGELATPWGELPPGELVRLARYYAAARADSETDPAKSRRNSLIVAFAKQYRVPATPPKPAAQKPAQPKPKPPPTKIKPYSTLEK